MPAPSERIVFAHTVQAMVERSGAAADPQIRKQLVRLGITPDAWLPGYPQAIWLEALSMVATWRFPNASPTEAEYQLGIVFIEGYANTFIGTALFAMLKVLPSQRVVDRLTRSFRTGTNYTEVEIVENVPGRARVRINTVEPRGEFTRAVLQRGLQLGGIATLTASIERLDGEGADYLLTW